MPIEEAQVEGLRGFVSLFEASNPGQKARVKDLAYALSYNSRMVGTPESIADKLEAWQDAGIDGVNMICQYFPGSYRDFIENVMPVLQKRGLAQKEYAPGSLREKMFPGSGGRLRERHPAAKYRGAFKRDVEKSATTTGVKWDSAPVPETV